MLGLLFCCLVELHCEDSHEISIPYLCFKGQHLSNNSYVDNTKIGNDNSLSVQCCSELQGCCYIIYLSGSWSFPNGSKLMNNSVEQSIY